MTRPMSFHDIFVAPGKNPMNKLSWSVKSYKQATRAKRNVQIPNRTNRPFQTSPTVVTLPDRAKSDDGNLVVPRVLNTVSVAAAIVMAVGSSTVADPNPGPADDGNHQASVSAPPMVARPPFPSGYKRATAVHLPLAGLHLLLQPEDLDTLQTPCLVFDIGTDGRVTNVLMLRPSGSTIVDQFAMATAADSRYQPATVDGQPIVERIISERLYIIGNHRTSGTNCTWDMYDAFIAQHSPVPTHNQPASVP